MFPLRLRPRAPFGAALLGLLTVLSACTGADTAKRRYLESGNRRLAENKYAEAIIDYRDALGVDDKFAEARVMLAEALAASGDREGAYREYIRAADLLPNDADVQKKAATLLFMAGQFQDVRSRAEAVLRQNPKDLDAQLLYANALVGLRDLESGVREIEEAIQMDPSYAASYTNLALLKVAQGQGEAAATAFQKAVELDPKSLKARLALAHFELATGNVAMAEASLKLALELSPKDPLTNRALAALYVGTGRDALAERPLKLVAEVTGSLSSKLMLAEYYARHGRVNEATAVLEPMTKDENSYTDAQTRLAQLAYAVGEKPAADKMLNVVLKRYPSHPLALQVKARWLLQEGRPVQALDRAAAAAAAAPGDAGVLYLRGLLQAINGQRAAAIKSFNEVLRLNPRAAAARVQLAQLNLGGGEYDTAVGLAQEAVSNAPGVPEARLLLARALVAQRDLVGAEAEVARLLAAYPNAAAAHAVNGTLQLVKGDPVKARAAYQRAFDIDPRSIAAVGGLTLLDAQERKLAAARQRLEQRLVAEPKRAELLVMAAKVYIGEGDLAKAEASLRQLIAQAPLLADPYVLLGEIYRSQNRLDAARADFDAQVQRDAGNLGARIMAAMLTHAQGKASDARRRYTELLELEPRAAVAANNLAWMYADQRQNLDLALQLAERATEQLPDYAEAWDTLGWVHFQKQVPILAVQPFEKALAMDPQNATFHYHLGLALAGSGDRDRSRGAFQTALKLQPGYAEAQRAMAALDE